MTAKELFEKCNQLGTSNADVKQELLHCLESGKKLKDLNTKLHFCKDYLEQQVSRIYIRSCFFFACEWSFSAQREIELLTGLNQVLWTTAQTIFYNHNHLSIRCFVKSFISWSFVLTILALLFWIESRPTLCKEIS